MTGGLGGLVLQALGVAAIYALMWAADNLAGGSYLDRPIVCCALVGALLGDFPAGLVMGGTMELVWMGFLSFAGVIDSEPRFGAVLGSFLSLRLGAGVGLAIALALPLSYVGGWLSARYNDRVSREMNERCPAWAAVGDLRAICRFHLRVGLVKCALMSGVVLAVALACALPVAALVTTLPAGALVGMDAVVGLLLAVAVAMLVNLVWDKRFLQLFFAGLTLAGYLRLSVLAVAIFGCACAVAWTGLRKGEGLRATRPPIPEPDAFSPTRAEIRQMFWRSMPLEISYNTEREHNLLYVFTLTPLLERLYADDHDALVQAARRHLDFMNTTPQIEPLVLGVTANLEAANARSGNQMGPMVTQVKQMLMGPTGILGDTLFHSGGFRVVAACAGSALCIAGQPLGLVVYALVFDVPNYLAHWWGIRYGCELGTSVMEWIANSGLSQRAANLGPATCMACAGALTGLFVVLPGAWGVTVPWLVVPWVGCALVWACVWLTRTANANPTLLMAGVLVAGAVLGSLGLL